MTVLHGWRVAERATVAVILFVAAAVCAADDPAVPAPSKAVAATVETDDAAVEAIIAPQRGRPAFVTPGGALPFVMQVRQAGEVSAFLSAPFSPRHHLRLQLPDGAAEAVSAGRSVQARIPTGTPARLYDLEVHVGGRRLIAPRAVMVRPSGEEKLRIAHISDLNLGHPLVGAHVDRRLIDELNLLGVELVVLTGDLVDRSAERPEQAWENLIAALDLLHAPVLAAAGDQDDPERFARHFGISPLGSFEAPPFRGLVLVDHAGSPAQADVSQTQWAEATLGAANFDGLSFVVSHASAPGLLRRWLRQGQAREMIRAARIGLWFTGGDAPAAGQHFDGEIGPMQLIRTGHAGGLDGGVPRYRVMDVTRSSVTLLSAAEGRARDLPVALAVGRLSGVVHGPNDGSRELLRFDVLNHHPFAIHGVQVRAVLRRTPESEPWCRGGRIVRATPVGGVWELVVELDVPDHGSVRGLIGSGAALTLPDVGVAIEAPVRTTNDAGRGRASVTIVNRSAQPVAVTPVITLAGHSVPWRLADTPWRMAAAVMLQPNAPLELEVAAPVDRPGPVRPSLQVYLQGLPVRVPTVYRLERTGESPAG